MSILTDYLAELVRAQLEGKKAKALPEELKFEEIVELSHKNHMDYLLMGALLNTEGLEEKKSKILRAYVMQSIIKTTTQVMELKKIIRRFEEKEIVNQPMKGAKMKFIYPRPEMREMSDIDILIRQDCMEKAEDELKEMGYTLHQAIKHHDIYVKAPLMVVEAHRAMYDKTVDNKQYDYFSDFSKTVLQDGCSYTYDFKTEDFYI